MASRWRWSIAAGLVALLTAASPLQAQTDGDAPATEEGTTNTPMPSSSSLCIDVNARAYEAALVIRSHAAALSQGFDPEARPEALQMLGWMDQWMGRLKVLVDVAEGGQCLDESDLETYRRALAIAVRVGNQARTEILRPVRPPQQARTRR